MKSFNVLTIEYIGSLPANSHGAKMLFEGYVSATLEMLDPKKGRRLIVGKVESKGFGFHIRLAVEAAIEQFKMNYIEWEFNSEGFKRSNYDGEFHKKIDAVKYSTEEIENLFINTDWSNFEIPLNFKLPMQ